MRTMPMPARPAPSRIRLLRALANPSRLSILEALRGGPRCVGEVVTRTGLTQSNVSNHLACLRDCGLVASRTRGRHVFYRLAAADVARLLERIEALDRRAGARVEACRRLPGRTRDRAR